MSRDGTSPPRPAAVAPLYPFPLAALAAVWLTGLVSAGPPPFDAPLEEGLPAFREPTGAWQLAGDVSLDPADRRRLAARPGTGVLSNGEGGHTSNLLTRKEYGDVEAHIEFAVAEGQNSGVYFMGRYEIQLFDSWDAARDRPKENPSFSDCGGIYQRWDPARGSGKEGYDGHPPRLNACRRPGEWQSFDVVFRAPRFDPEGKKTENARFVKVVHNGVLIHEDVELTGPTRAATYEREPEKPRGPLMLQGDHGSVAYRRILIGPLSPAPERSDGFPSEVLDDRGFTAIFDGRTLEGWHVSAKTGHSGRSGHRSGGRWVVEEGAITGSQDIPGNGGIIITDREYGDFEVVLEMRNDFGPDSGLFLRSTEDGKAYQYLVDYHGGGNVAGLYGEGIRPGFHLRNYSFLEDPSRIREMEGPYPLPVKPEAWRRFWKHGEWNELRARITGNPPAITTWINRVRFMEWQDPQERHPDRGGIALQVHGGGNFTKQFVRYRGIRVKDLEGR